MHARRATAGVNCFLQAPSAPATGFPRSRAGRARRPIRILSWNAGHLGQQQWSEIKSWLKTERPRRPAMSWPYRKHTGRKQRSLHLHDGTVCRQPFPQQRSQLRLKAREEGAQPNVHFVQRGLGPRSLQVHVTPRARLRQERTVSWCFSLPPSRVTRSCGRGTRRHSLGGAVRLARRPHHSYCCLSACIVPGEDSKGQSIGQGGSPAPPVSLCQAGPGQKHFVHRRRLQIFSLPDPWVGKPQLGGNSGVSA